MLFDTAPSLLRIDLVQACRTGSFGYYKSYQISRTQAMTDSAFPRPDAAAASAQHRAIVLSRSFRLHRPRGAFCHAGWCEQCRVTLPDGSIALACQTRDARAARHRLAPPAGPHRRPTAALVLRASSAAADGAAAVLPEQSAPDVGRTRLAASLRHPAPWRDRRCGLLVVGGGLAGLDGSSPHHATGDDVLLVEAEEFGGRARFQPAPARSSPPCSRACRATALLGTTCVGLYGRGARPSDLARGAGAARFRAPRGRGRRL